MNFKKKKTVKKTFFSHLMTYVRNVSDWTSYKKTSFIHVHMYMYCKILSILSVRCNHYT